MPVASLLLLLTVALVGVLVFAAGHRTLTSPLADAEHGAAPLSPGVGTPDPLAAPDTAVPTDTVVPTPAPTLPPTPIPTPTLPPLPALLPDNLIVAYYGNPLAKEMGILGEVPPDEMLNRLKQQADAYASADDSRPVIPALELVTPAAQRWPGDDGMYRARMQPELIDQVAGWAEANNALLILDLQIGRSSVPAEVDVLMPYLRRPYVHLALDPEFAMPSGRVPGQALGSLDAADIEAAVHTLSRLVTDGHLPPKILIVHRFTESMLTNTRKIGHDPNVQVVIAMDGFGPPNQKLTQYRAYVHDEGVGYSGIKLFYHHDNPLMSPEQVVGLDPHPDLVIYQ
ncbi:MAG: hypothetical protein JO057_01380 [Chloroflexi bacterium]|nr:hypothetical protein [Chloroflexota bacterium]